MSNCETPDCQMRTGQVPEASDTAAGLSEHLLHVFVCAWASMPE